MDARSEEVSLSQLLQTVKNPNIRRYLIIVGTLFFALAAPLVSFIEWAGWRLGATVPLSTLAREQEGSEKVLWLGAFKDYGSYKLERVKLAQPDVLLVGSSRCGQVRAQMFRPYKTFNACLTAWPLDHAVDFIDRATREAKPRVVIVALDYFLFGDSLAETWRKERTMDFGQGLEAHRRKLNDVIDYANRAHWNVVELLGSSQARFEPIDHNRLLGVEATRGQFGFRSDGSILVAPSYRLTSAAQLANGRTFMRDAFVGAEHLSERQFQQLVLLSQLAIARRFSVVAIQYPILKSSTDFLDNDQSNWKFAGEWRELRSEATAEKFADLGIKFFDMSRDPLNKDPINFIDPVHPTERGTLFTMISLLEHQKFRELLPEIDKSALEDDARKSLRTGEKFDLYH